MQLSSSTPQTRSRGDWLELGDPRPCASRRRLTARAQRMILPQPLQSLPTAESCDVLVIGAGIVGVAVALRLRQRGRDVLLIDRERVAAQASRRQRRRAGVLGRPAPRLARHAASRRRDGFWIRSGRSRSDLAILPRLAPWLLRFWRASRPERVRAGIAAQAAMMDLSAAETPSLLQQRRRRRHAAQRRRSAPVRERGGAAGVAGRMAGPRRPWHRVHAPARRAAPSPSSSRALVPKLVAATFVPGWKTVSDPLRVTEALARHFERMAAESAAPMRWRSHPAPTASPCDCATGRRWSRARVVVAAGAWSHHLARTLGERIPLETERGYNTTLPAGAFDLKRQLTFDGHGFVVTSLRCGIRVGGAVEFAGLDAPPNFARAKRCSRKPSASCPACAPKAAREWMGFRPSLPDSLPAIGPAARGRARHLRVRPRPPRPHAGRGDGAPCRRHLSRVARRRIDLATVQCRRRFGNRFRASDSPTATARNAHDRLPHARHRPPPRHGLDRLRVHRPARPRPAVRRATVDFCARGAKQRRRRRRPAVARLPAGRARISRSRDRSRNTGWLKRALDDYHVLLLDSRGNGRSSVVLPQTLARRGNARAQADYLMHFRADSIVRDAELIRRAARRRERAVERARAELRRVLRGALPVRPSAGPARSLHHRWACRRSAAAPTTITGTRIPRSRARRASSSRAIRTDVDCCARIMEHLHRHDVALADRRASDGPPLPAGRLHARASTTGWRISTTCSKTRSARALDGDELSLPFLRALENSQSFETNPIFAVLHEMCYTQRAASRWSARARSRRVSGHELGAGTSRRRSPAR